VHAAWTAGATVAQAYSSAFCCAAWLDTYLFYVYMFGVSFSRYTARNGSGAAGIRAA